MELLGPPSRACDSSIALKPPFVIREVVMKRHLPQSSPAIPATAVDSDTPENMDMDYDVIRSLNNVRTRKQDAHDESLTPSIMDRESNESGRETHILRSSYKVAQRTFYVEVQFYIIHHEDTAYVTTVSTGNRDRKLEHSIESARRLYRTLLSRGYTRN